MAQVGPLRERPVRDGLALISPLSQVRSRCSGLHRERSTCLVLWAEHNIFSLTFQVRRYFVPAFSHSHTKEVPSYFQSAMVHSKVERIRWVSGGPLAIRCLLKPARMIKLALAVHDLVHHGNVCLLPSLLHGLEAQLYRPFLVGISC